MILNHYAAPLAQRDSWVQRIEVGMTTRITLRASAALLEQMGLDRSTLRLEKTYPRRRTLGRSAGPAARSNAGRLHRDMAEALDQGLGEFNCSRPRLISNMKRI